ncbi:hypothetical protein C0585_01880 [Candidatus Woesearchaeota archaeon]|nr:MAG: hypothetical protein C0585_01880 [Candidatus Woesearchaeota archaeon]
MKNLNEIKIISTKKNDVNKKNGLTKYLYKKVFTKDGEKIGRVKQIIFNKENIEGIILSKFFCFNKMFIDMEYVDKFTSDSVLLKINPLVLVVGKKVFDAEGKDLGKVKKIIRKSNANAMDSLIIKKSIFSKEIIVQPKDIQFIKKTVRLNISI